MTGKYELPVSTASGRFMREEEKPKSRFRVTDTAPDVSGQSPEQLPGGMLAPGISTPTAPTGTPSFREALTGRTGQNAPNSVTWVECMDSRIRRKSRESVFLV